MAIEELYHYNEECLGDYESGEYSTGRPQWCKLWADKYAVALDIENLNNDLSEKEKDDLFREVGKAFINGMIYFLAHDEKSCIVYKLKTRDGRILWNALKRDIDQSYRDYEKSVENGKKGGRPKKDKQETNG